MKWDYMRQPAAKIQVTYETEINNWQIIFDK